MARNRRSKRMHTLTRRNMGAGEFDLSDWMVGNGPAAARQ
jgi:hypothetical protein